MGQLRKSLAKHMPVLRSAYRALLRQHARYRSRSKTAEQIFNEIYRSNAWGGEDSASGRGSDLDQTENILKELPSILREFSVSSILDIPCGDFHWMKNLDLGDVDYVGADIVAELIQNNTRQYGRECLRFEKLDLIKDTLPAVDLIFCRDCLVHLSFADITSCLKNMCDSQSKYILTTTFTGRSENYDIATGQWRALNLQIAPFLLPQPLRTVNEGCTQWNGSYRDKGLGLWRVADVRKSLGLVQQSVPLSAA